ncbi:MAG: hypothetical protein PVH61_32520 [Candidatus Aminicenantes bacterium]
MPIVISNASPIINLAIIGIRPTFDCLVENNAPGTDVWVCYGTQAGELDQKFTHFER